MGALKVICEVVLFWKFSSSSVFNFRLDAPIDGVHLYLFYKVSITENDTPLR